MTTSAPNDPFLYSLARRRVGLQRRAITHLVLIAFLTLAWYLTSGPGHPFWPGWAALGLGLGLTIRYTKLYVIPRTGAVEREYENLATTRPPSK